MICYDHNKTQLTVGDAVMCHANGEENEGTVLDLLENNKILLCGENGKDIIVDANDCYWLP